MVAVDEGQEHTMSVWDWQRGERGSKITETKVWPLIASVYLLVPRSLKAAKIRFKAEFIKVAC